MRNTLAIGLASLLVATAASAETTWNFSSFAPRSHSLIVGAVTPWMAEVEKATQGRVSVNILPKAVANPAGHFDAVRDGLADAAWIVHGYTPGRFTLTKIAEFPFLGKDATATSVAYWHVYQQHFAKADEHKGVKLLSLFTHGPGQPYNTQRQIVTISDFDGLKFRVGGGIVNDVAKALGVVSLLKPAPESYELLSSGVADGVFLPVDSIKSYKLDKLVKHITLVPGGLYNTSFALIMNEAKFKALSAQDQAAVMKVSGEHFARLAGKSWDAGDAEAIKLAKEAGIKLTPASPGLMRSIRSRTAAIEDAWIQEAKGAGVDGAAALTALRAEVEKLEE